MCPPMDTRDLPLSAQGAGARTRRSAVRLLREALVLDEPPLEVLAMLPGATESMWEQQEAAPTSSLTSTTGVGWAAKPRAQQHHPQFCIPCTHLQYSVQLMPGVPRSARL